MAICGVEAQHPALLKPPAHCRASFLTRHRCLRFRNRRCDAAQPLTPRICVVKATASIMQELDSRSPSSPQKNEKHLIIMANGLYGNASNWNVVTEHLRRVLDTSETLLIASDANSLTQTFDGIDSCGDRLAAEIQTKVKEHPSLHKISFIGHSMGGLLVRYAAGKLYDPSSELICGLRPAHFITMATPHMGCDGRGPAQVPFIGWTGDIPLAGSSLQKLLQSAAKPFVSVFMKRTGRQFFMHDTEEGQVPLLVRMTEDIPGEGFFISALNSFVSRTCYGNAGGDHLVGWANSSIRHPDELPTMEGTLQRKGVIREDPLQAALHPEAAAAFVQHHASPGGDNVASDLPCKAAEHSEYREGVMDAALNMSTTSLHQAHDAAGDSSLPSSSHQLECEDELNGVPAVDGHSEGQQQRAAEQIADSSRNALLILQRLQTLPWRRVDVSFEGTNMPFFAHNHMQVTRKWLNWYGVSVCQHLAQQLADMEKDESIQKAVGCSTALSLSS